MKYKGKEIKSKVDMHPSQIIIKTRTSYPYYNCFNGAVGDTAEEVAIDDMDKCVVYANTKGRDVGVLDAKYDEELELLILILYRISIKGFKENIPRTPIEEAKVYIDKDKNLYYEGLEWSYDNRTGWDKEALPMRRRNRETGFSDIPFSFKYPFLGKCVETEIAKMFSKVVTLQGNKTVVLNTAENLMAFIKYKEPIVKNGAKQQLVEELTSIELDEISTVDKSILSEDNKFAVISPVNGEELCVIRTFIYEEENDNIVEGGRIYVGAKEIVPCKLNNNNKYIRTSLLSKVEHWNFPISHFEKNVTKGTLLEYFGEMIEEINAERRGLAIWAFLKWPIFEKLFKSDLSEYVKEIINVSKWDNPLSMWEHHFGPINKNKNLYKAIGMNKHQVDVIVKNEDIKLTQGWRREFSNILISKVILAKADYGNYYFFYRDMKNMDLSINDIDENTFDEIYALSQRINKVSVYRDVIISVFCDISKLYGCQVVTKLADKIFDLFDECGANGYNESYFYRDYLRMVGALGNTVNFKPYFKTRVDINEMHDAITNILNLKHDEYRYEAFRKRMETWKKWEYSEDDYIVIAPDEPEKLAQEGMELHHCVKTYIDRVSDGITNIMFIRKATDVEKPFFTVEISNSGNIEQIHGSCNRNLNTEPDLIPFVKKWAKEIKLKEHNYNKVR